MFIHPLRVRDVAVSSFLTPVLALRSCPTGTLSGPLGPFSLGMPTHHVASLLPSTAPEPGGAEDAGPWAAGPRPSAVSQACVDAGGTLLLPPVVRATKMHLGGKAP